MAPTHLLGLGGLVTTLHPAGPLAVDETPQRTSEVLVVVSVTPTLTMSLGGTLGMSTGLSPIVPRDRPEWTSVVVDRADRPLAVVAIAEASAARMLLTSPGPAAGPGPVGGVLQVVAQFLAVVVDEAFFDLCVVAAAQLFDQPTGGQATDPAAPTGHLGAGRLLVEVGSAEAPAALAGTDLAAVGLAAPLHVAGRFAQQPAVAVDPAGLVPVPVAGAEPALAERPVDLTALDEAAALRADRSVGTPQRGRATVGGQPAPAQLVPVGDAEAPGLDGPGTILEKTVTHRSG